MIPSTVSKPMHPIESHSREHYAIKNGRLQKFLTITTVSQFTFEAVNTTDHIQKSLNERAIPLNCSNPPRQMQRNHIRQEAVEEFLGYVEKQQPKKYNLIKNFWERGVSRITLEELDENLKKCAGYLDRCLNGKPFDVGFIKGKSSKWIAELALVSLSQSPKGYFFHATDTGGSQSPVSQDSKCFVIFDDASYSGSQLVSIVNALQSQLIEQEKKGKLFLVVPFMSKVAQTCIVENLTRLFRAPMGSGNYAPERILKVHLITSSLPVKLFSDFLPSSANYQGITFTEWKIPDTTSLSSMVSGAEITLPNGETRSLSFLTNFRPCYKVNDSDLTEDV